MVVLSEDDCGQAWIVSQSPSVVPSDVKLSVCARGLAGGREA
jgi:hypothetical protein